jgi:ABC-2 type transport system permease protein
VLLLFLGLAVALIGLWPKGRSIAWVVFGLSALIGYMGPGINLPDWLVDASPFAAVGPVPAEDVVVLAVVLLTVVGLALLVAGFVGFGRRDVPRG